MNEVIEQSLETALAVPVKTEKKKKSTEVEFKVREKRKPEPMIKIKFIFHEVRNGLMSFNFSKKGPIKNITWKDGDIMDVPLSLYNYMKNAGKVPIHRWVMGESGKKVKEIGRYEERWDVIQVGNYINA